MKKLKKLSKTEMKQVLGGGDYLACLRACMRENPTNPGICNQICVLEQQ